MDGVKFKFLQAFYNYGVKCDQRFDSEDGGPVGSRMTNVLNFLKSILNMSDYF